MDMLKAAVTAWTAFLYAIVLYAVALILGLVGDHGLATMSGGQGVTILIAVAPAAIGLTVALRAWTPKHENRSDTGESH